jgi:rRNA maturation protein Nop10
MKKFKNCKQCKRPLVVGSGDYTFKEICRKCSWSNNIKKKWKNDKQYRLEQTARIMKWQKENPERTKEIGKIAMKKYHAKIAQNKLAK